MTDQKTNIFLSYNWADDEIANGIYNYFENNFEIALHRDKIDIGKWRSIKEYMQSICAMDYTILIISDAYLKSENCMCEVLEVMRDQKYKEKIFPAVISTEIYSPLERVKYIKYWKNQFNKLDQELREIDPHEMGKLGEDSKRRLDIKNNIAFFLDTVADMNNPNISDINIAIENKLTEKKLCQDKDIVMVEGQLRSQELPEIQIDFDTIKIYNSSNYEPLHKLVGRKSQVESIMKILLNFNDFKPVFITGLPGIGKTEICKAVYKELKSIHVSIDMPFVNVTSVGTLGGFYKCVAEGLGIKIPNNTELTEQYKYLLQSINNRSTDSEIFVLYLDNWEDIWLSNYEDNDHKFELLKFLRDLKSFKIKILISSRILPPNCEIEPFEINPLTKRESIDLFLQVYGKKIGRKDRVDFEFLLDKLEGHTLAIILAACHAIDSPSLNYTIECWNKIEIIGSNEHSSLKKAIKMTWEFLKSYPEALDIWGLLAVSQREVRLEILEELKSENYSKDKWFTGIEKLSKLHLISKSKLNAITMLQPIKEQYFLFFENDEKDVKQKAILSWADCIILHFRNLFSNKDNYLKEHTLILELMPQIIFVARYLSQQSLELKKLDTIVYRMTDYLLFSIETEEFLKYICDYYKNRNQHKLYALLLQKRGEMYSHLHRINEAMDSFDEAESILKKENDENMLAKIYRSKGETLSKLWYEKNHELDAIRYLNQAEQMLSTRGDEISLANVLLVRGNLYIDLRNQKAIADLEKAEEIYRKRHIFLGTANVMRAKGSYYTSVKNFPTALKCLNEAERLYADLHVSVGKTDILFSKMSIFFQMNQYDDVLKCCEEAEKVVKKTREIYKMSEINVNKGAAFFGKKQIPQSIKILEEAKKLFEKENNFIGIADTTSRLYSCYYIEKDYKNRLKVLMEYVAVSSKIPEKFEFEFSLRIIFLGIRKETFVKRGLVKKLNNSSG